jgi:hypothetical protein
LSVVLTGRTGDFAEEGDDEELQDIWKREWDGLSLQAVRLRAEQMFQDADSCGGLHHPTVSHHHQGGGVATPGGRIRHPDEGCFDVGPESARLHDAGHGRPHHNSRDRPRNLVLALAGQVGALAHQFQWQHGTPGGNGAAIDTGLDEAARLRVGQVIYCDLRAVDGRCILLGDCGSHRTALWRCFTSCGSLTCVVSTSPGPSLKPKSCSVACPHKWVDIATNVS